MSDASKLEKMPNGKDIVVSPNQLDKLHIVCSATHSAAWLYPPLAGSELVIVDDGFTKDIAHDVITMKCAGKEIRMHIYDIRNGEAKFKLFQCM